MAKQPLAEPLAVVAGLRTPFVRAGGPLDSVDPESLLGGVLSELLERSGLVEALDLLVLNLEAQDALELDALEVLRRSVCAQSVTVRQLLPAAADDMQALSSLVEALQGGGVRVGALLGARLHRRGAPERLWWRIWNAIWGLRGSLERARGSDMQFEVRDAERSYGLAARAWGEGRFEDQVMPVLIPRGNESVVEDELRKHAPQSETSRSFGVAGLLLATQAEVERRRLAPLGWIRTMASESIPPTDAALAEFALDVLQGREPKLVEISDAQERGEALKRGLLASGVEWLEVADRLNVTGDDSAFGDAGCATFPRQITQLLYELERRGGGYGLCVCGGPVTSTAITLEVPRG